MKNKADCVKLKVMRPYRTGKAGIKNAKRLDTLNGKTICEAFRQHSNSGTSWRTSETFAVIRELLKKRFPDAKIIPHTDFQYELGTNEYPYWAPADKIGQVLRNRGCDAVLVGNGG